MSEYLPAYKIITFITPIKKNFDTLYIEQEQHFIKACSVES